MRISISLSEESIDAAIQKLEDYQADLERKAQTLCEKLASLGYDIASSGFGSAMYDGTNDVSVELNDEGDKLVIRASGDTVMFIEFGTGVHNPDHPMQGEIPGIVGHGQYGHGLGRLESWRYPKSKGYGTNGVDDPDHPGYIMTYGNPANMPMYNAKQDIRAQTLQIAREVFRS